MAKKPIKTSNKPKYPPKPPPTIPKVKLDIAKLTKLSEKLVNEGPEYVYDKCRDAIIADSKVELPPYLVLALAMNHSEMASKLTWLEEQYIQLQRFIPKPKPSEVSQADKDAYYARHPEKKPKAKGK